MNLLYGWAASNPKVRNTYLRFAIAAVATTGLAIVVDQYQEYRLSRSQAVNLRSVPSVGLPRPELPNQRIQSRIVWMDDNTFLHFLSHQTYGDKSKSAEKITLIRYRYASIAGTPTLQKLTEYKWPFGSEYSFTDENASEVHLSPDKQKVMMPLARKDAAWPRDHYLGVVRLHPESRKSSGTVWQIDPIDTGAGNPRLFWLPDSQHIAAFFDRTAIDMLDINRTTPARRIALDPIATDPKIREQHFADAAQIDLRATEAVGISPAGELVLLSRMPHPRTAPPFFHLCFETIPLSSDGVDENAVHTHFVPSDIGPADMDEIDLSPDGKHLLYRAFLPASRSNRKWIRETRWQNFGPRNFTRQFASLDLQTGKSTPLFQAEMERGTIHRMGAINGINFGARWLPGSQHISVSAESPGYPDNHLMWRLPVTH